MNESLEKINEMKTDEVEIYLPINKYTFSVQVKRLAAVLKKIKPRIGDFLFWDIIGRIVWNATATAKSIENLIEVEDHYGVSSLARKLFECQLLLDYLFQTDDKSRVIARIMAYEIFTDGDIINNDEVIERVKIIVNGFKEDDKIFNHFKYYLDRGPKHWHWSEKSFEKLAKYIEKKTGDPKLDDVLLNSKIDLLKLYHRGAHIDLDLNKDYLRDTPDGDVEYSSPFEKSDEILFAIIGLSRLIIMDIIEVVEAQLSKKLNT